MRVRYYKLALLDRDGNVHEYALVSPEDWPVVSQHRWSFIKPYGYVRRNLPRVPGEKRKMVYLHRQIMGDPEGFEVDHINGIPWDCRRENLRVVTRAQNAQNQRVRDNESSRFRGVWWQPARGHWVARVGLDGRTHYLGSFESEELAGRAAQLFREEHMRFSRT